MQSLVAQFNYLKQTEPTEYVAKTLKSKELLALIDAREKLFWWKPGHYTITLRPTALKSFSLTQHRYEFELAGSDVDRLKGNVASLETDLKNTINSNMPDFKAVPVSWNWAYPELLKMRG